MKVVTYIRSVELGVALASTYMVAVSMVQTSVYAKLKPNLIRFIGPIMVSFGADPAFIDIVLLGLAMALSFTFWRRGDEAGFGRLFSLNMLMFFPAVVDFSMFNWVNLILPYEPAPAVSAIWVFGVGLLLQATYLFLRYTVRFRGLRDELLNRGAESDDVDEVSKGQIFYLASLVLGTSALSTVVYYLVPFMRELFTIQAYGLPYPHIVIGIACSLLIAAATILYLRGGGRRAKVVVEKAKKEKPAPTQTNSSPPNEEPTDSVTK